MKILLAIDGSPYSIKAVKYIAAHFDFFAGGAELHLLTVKLPIPSGLALVQARKILGADAVDKYYEEEARAILAPAEEVLRAAAIPFRSGFKVGQVAEEIIAYAAAKKIDMIVVGSHGHSAIGNLLMGSVATKVLAAASMPVLVIR